MNVSKIDGRTRRRYETQARIVKALAHPTRLFIVEELSRGERCVRDLTERIGADISTVSRHLATLRQAGVLNGERRGTQVFYSLKLPCVMKMFDCVEPILEATAREHLEAISEL
jgi:ArsR family transcriptional regulator